MPQTRKRKTNEKTEAEDQKKERKNSAVTSNSRKRKTNETSNVLKIAPPKKSLNSVDHDQSPGTSSEDSADKAVFKGKKCLNKENSSKKKESKKLKVNSNINKDKLHSALNESVLDTNDKRKKGKNKCLKNDVKQKEATIIALQDLKTESHSGECGNFNQSYNSSDSGILSETACDSKLKLSMKSEFCNDLSKVAVSKSDNESSSESEWEEVEENCELSLDDYKPEIPKEGVEITIDCPEFQVRKRKKKKFDENEWIRLHINRVRKDIQLSLHKTHLLCLLAHGFYVNKVLNSDTIKALAISVVPEDVLSITSGKKVDVDGIQKIIFWYRETFTFVDEKTAFLNLFSSLLNSFQSKKTLNSTEYNLIFIAIARILGFNVRLCVSFYPITHKASNLIKKTKTKEDGLENNLVKETGESSTSVKKEIKTKVKKEPKISKKTKKKQDCVSKEIKEKYKVSRPRRSKSKSYKISSDEGDGSDDDDDFVVPEVLSSDEDDKKIRRHNLQKASQKNKSNRKVLSSDSEEISLLDSETNKLVCWAEVFSKPEKQWISIDCVNNIVNKPYDIEEIVCHPISYIVAFDNESYVKDVTRRYCNNYMTDTVKLHVDPDWWEETLEPFSPPNSKLNKEEEKKLDELLVNKPLPHTVQGFKNHPLYALKRHLLKFEAIYPPNAPTVGFMRSEPIYARDCVHQLHSRETWLKEARVVRIGEEPYKVVKARPKWDKIAGVLRTDLPLEIFGLWQTEPYEPPIAVNGKVPRNEYGNVELFKPCMLPRGTVHLQLPGLNRIAKKLNIDCSPAVVGFDGHKGSVHPVFDGFIICEEFKDVIIAAWDEEQENIRKREEEKREKRIYGNWKKLIKGLLIRERIQLKYHSEKS